MERRAQRRGSKFCKEGRDMIIEAAPVVPGPRADTHRYIPNTKTASSA